MSAKIMAEPQNADSPRREGVRPPRDIDTAFAEGLAFAKELNAGAPSKPVPLDAIRRKCLDCTAGDMAEIRRCHIRSCALWPFRFGHNPFHARSKGPRHGEG